MFDRKIGAEGSVLQELLLFVILTMLKMFAQVTQTLFPFMKEIISISLLILSNYSVKNTPDKWCE